VWRTDTEGSISIRTDGQTMTVKGRRGAVTYPVN
jgi:beta-lactamase superfamily II metal-dependent hydrolase